MTVINAKDLKGEEKYSFFEKECDKRVKRTKGALRDFYRNARNGFQIKMVKEGENGK